MAFASSNAK
jgi:spartin